jgi:Protein of unknown function (DUF1258)
MFDRPDFRSNIKNKFHADPNKTTLSDVIDGELYKKVYRFVIGAFDLTFMLYTDGAQIFKSCKNSVWPILLVINELPYHLRFLPQNIIFAGLWWNKGKPNFNLFMEPLIEQLKILKERVQFTLTNNQIIEFGAFVLNFTADKPAKSAMMCMSGHNGKSSCPKCYIVGMGVQVAGRLRKVFCFSQTVNLRLRTTPEAKYHSSLGTSKKPYLGFKGTSSFSKIVPDFINSISEDIMHCLYGGINKKKLDFWLSKDYQGSLFNCYSLENLNRVNKRIKHIMRPPHFVRRRLRPLDQLAFYKTSEFKNWFLYYAIPIMYDLLDEKCLVHFFKLFTAVFLLNSEQISLNDISQARNLLIEYTEEFKTLYGDFQCTFTSSLC